MVLSGLWLRARQLGSSAHVRLASASVMRHAWPASAVGPPRRIAALGLCMSRQPGPAAARGRRARLRARLRAPACACVRWADHTPPGCHAQRRCRRRARCAARAAVGEDAHGVAAPQHPEALHQRHVGAQAHPGAPGRGVVGGRIAVLQCALARAARPGAAAVPRRHAPPALAHAMPRAVAVDDRVAAPQRRTVAVVRFRAPRGDTRTTSAPPSLRRHRLEWAEAGLAPAGAAREAGHGRVARRHQLEVRSARHRRHEQVLHRAPVARGHRRRDHPAQRAVLQPQAPPPRTPPVVHCNVNSS